MRAHRLPLFRVFAGNPGDPFSVTPFHSRPPSPSHTGAPGGGYDFQLPASTPAANTAAAAEAPAATEAAEAAPADGGAGEKGAEAVGTSADDTKSANVDAASGEAQPKAEEEGGGVAEADKAA